MTAADEDDVRRELTELVRASGRDVLATLARWTGNLALAEDAVQDATVRALETWPRDGVPESPVAWLRTVARRRAVDLIRREAARGDKETAAMQVVIPDEEPEPSAVADDLLRLVFTCCHPSLAPETQVALSLRTLCGLTTPEVARALLVSEASMAKRLTRARQKILQAHIPYRVPADDELPQRWAAVLATTYLVFNEGYAADVRPPARARRARRRGRPAGPAAGAAPTRRPRCARAAGADAAAGLTPGHAGRRRRRHGAARRPGPHPLGRRADRGGRHPGRRGAAALAGPARPLRRAGGDRGLPRPGAVVRRDGLGRDRVLVRRAAHPRRRPGGPAQPRRRGGRARRRRRGPGPGRRDRRPGRRTRCGTPPAACCCVDSTGPRRRRPPTRGPRPCLSTTPSGRCSGARRCPAR